jgi:hypothetical protein
MLSVGLSFIFITAPAARFPRCAPPRCSSSSFVYVYLLQPAAMRAMYRVRPLAEPPEGAPAVTNAAAATNEPCCIGRAPAAAAAAEAAGAAALRVSSPARRDGAVAVAAAPRGSSADEDDDKLHDRGCAAADAADAVDDSDACFTPPLQTLAAAAVLREQQQRRCCIVPGCGALICEEARAAKMGERNDDDGSNGDATASLSRRQRVCVPHLHAEAVLLGGERMRFCMRCASRRRARAHIFVRSACVFLPHCA